VDGVTKGQSFGPRVKLLVGGEREGWLSWSSLLEGVEAKHTHVKTHKDQVNQPPVLGEREGWLSWSSLLEGVEAKHTHVKTHKDQVN
jgi:hypothetical protein